MVDIIQSAAAAESHEARPLLTILHIQTVVAEHFGLSIEALLSERRARAYARPRQVAMWLAMKLLPGHSLPRIGRSFCRDHTTLIHSRRVIEEAQRADIALRAKIERLEERILSTSIVPVEAQIRAEQMAEDAAEAFRRAMLKLAARDPEDFVRRIGNLFGDATE